MDLLYYAPLFLMLFLPFLDRKWRVPALWQSKNIALNLVLLSSCVILLFIDSSQWPFFIGTLLFAALPEEWFFRVYLMTRIKLKPWQVNVLVSIAFSLLHVTTRGWSIGLQVFVPSLFYGWVYQQRHDLVLVVLLHALSNLVFVMFLWEFV